MENSSLILADDSAPRARRRKSSPFHQIIVPLAALAALGGVAYLASQQGKSGSGGGVALIDLDRVAKALGRDEAMAKATEDEQKAASQRVEGIAQALQKQFEEGQASAGLILDDEGRKKLATLSQTLSQQYNESRQKAAAEVTQKTTEMVNQFREEVKPHAVSAANARGLSLIVTKNDSVVFNAQPSVDVTDEVIARMKKETGQNPAPAVAPDAIPAPPAPTETP